MRYTELEKKFKSLYNGFRTEVKTINTKEVPQFAYLVDYLDRVINYMHDFYNDNIAEETDFLVIDVKLYRCMYNVRKAIKQTIEACPCGKDNSCNVVKHQTLDLLWKWVNQIDENFSRSTMNKLVYELN